MHAWMVEQSQRAEFLAVWRVELGSGKTRCQTWSPDIFRGPWFSVEHNVHVLGVRMRLTLDGRGGIFAQCLSSVSWCLFLRASEERVRAWERLTVFVEFRQTLPRPARARAVEVRVTGP